MAKKQEAKEVVLSAEIPSCELRYNDPATGWDLHYETPGGTNEGPLSAGWSDPGAGQAFTIAFKTTIDLRGLTAQEKTLFTTAATVQQSGPMWGTYILPTPLPGGHSTPIDYRFFDRMVVSDVPLTDDDMGFMDGITGAGMLGTNIDSDWEQVLYARHRTLTIPQKATPNIIDTTAPPPVGGHQEWSLVNTYTGQVVSENLYGSGSPTASDKLYVYYFVRLYAGPFDPGVGATIKIPSTRFVLGGFTAKESDLSHLMRLRRSIEQAGGN